jgi:hypothetical protein
MVAVAGQSNITLQQNINEPNITLSSQCPDCGGFQVRTTAFQSLPPLLAFEWGSQPPVLSLTLMATTHHGQGATYHLKGVVYHGMNHFTAHVIDVTGQVWYHDGMQTSLQRTLTLEQTRTCPLPTAIVAVYACE